MKKLYINPVSCMNCNITKVAHPKSVQYKKMLIKKEKENN